MARQIPISACKRGQPEEIPLDGRADLWSESNHTAAKCWHQFWCIVQPSCQGSMSESWGNFHAGWKLFSQRNACISLIRSYFAKQMGWRISPLHSWVAGTWSGHGGCQGRGETCPKKESPAEIRGFVYLPDSLQQLYEGAIILSPHFITSCKSGCTSV